MAGPDEVSHSGSVYVFGPHGESVLYTGGTTPAQYAADLTPLLQPVREQILSTVPGRSAAVHAAATQLWRSRAPMRSADGRVHHADVGVPLEANLSAQVIPVEEGSYVRTGGSPRPFMARGRRHSGGSCAGSRSRPVSPG